MRACCILGVPLGMAGLVARHFVCRQPSGHMMGKPVPNRALGVAAPTLYSRPALDLGSSPCRSWMPRHCDRRGGGVAVPPDGPGRFPERLPARGAGWSGGGGPPQLSRVHPTCPGGKQHGLVQVGPREQFIALRGRQRLAWSRRRMGSAPACPSITRTALWMLTLSVPETSGTNPTVARAALEQIRRSRTPALGLALSSVGCCARAICRCSMCREALLKFRTSVLMGTCGSSGP